MRIFHRTPPEAHASPVLFSDHRNLDRIEPQLDELGRATRVPDNGLDPQVSNFIASIGLRLLRWFSPLHSWRHRRPENRSHPRIRWACPRAEGNHGNEIAQKYAHEVVILDLQIYALLGQIYGRLGNNELASKYATLSRVTPVPIKETR